VQDVLINNAGVVSGKPILETTDDEVLQTMAVNALAPFWTVKAFLPSMKERKSGHIVNIGSVLGTAAHAPSHTHTRTCTAYLCLASIGIFGGAQLTDYSASKFAVFGFTECLRMELKSEGSPICTTLICPFHIDTGTPSSSSPPPPSLSSSPSSLSLTNAHCPTWNAKACSRG
jgi:all-trans-retinol dehydrogenase (NAD+)